MQSNNYYNPYGEKCLTEEEKGRLVGEMCLDEFLSDYHYKLELTELRAAVDMRGEVLVGLSTIPFCIEIKQRIKSEETLKSFPDCELRRDKLARMMKEAPKGTDLLYMVLLNESECYIFNLKLIDWSSLKKFEWKIRDIQVNENSGYSYYTTYSLPTDLAICKIDCSGYFRKIKG